MWYLNSKYKDTKTNELRSDKFDDEFIHHMNVEEAWKMGYSGKGVVVSIIDDGIEYTHEGQGQQLAEIKLVNLTLLTLGRFKTKL